jgi:hypothetical protein
VSSPRPLTVHAGSESPRMQIFLTVGWAAATLRLHFFSAWRFICPASKPWFVCVGVPVNGKSAIRRRHRDIDDDLKRAFAFFNPTKKEKNSQEEKQNS